MPSNNSSPSGGASETEAAYISVDATAGVPYNFRYSVSNWSTKRCQEGFERTEFCLIRQEENESPCQAGHLRVIDPNDQVFVAELTAHLGRIRISGSHTDTLKDFWEKLGRGESAWIDITGSPARLRDAAGPERRSANTVGGAIIRRENGCFSDTSLYLSFAQSSCNPM